MSLRQSLSIAAFLACSATGCSWYDAPAPAGLPMHDGGGVALLENPFHTPIQDSEFLWRQIVDTIDDYFKIQREQRVRVVGGFPTEGRIETYPAVGATLFEPWRRDSTPGFERWQSTLQSIQRRATVRVTPAPGGYLVEVAVYKELEDLERPEHATVGTAVHRHDGTIVRVEPRSIGGALSLGWIPQGRDTSLEQRILGELQGRLSAPPGSASG